MAHGTWKTTGGGAQITAGGVVAVIGAVVVIADRHGIEHGADEALTVLAVAVVVLLVLAVAGIVLVGRLPRRGEDRFVARLAEHRTVPAANFRPLPRSTVRASSGRLSPPAVHYHFHGDAAQIFPGAVVSRGPGKLEIPYPDPRDGEVPQ